MKQKTKNIIIAVVLAVVLIGMTVGIAVAMDLASRKDDGTSEGGNLFDYSDLKLSDHIKLGAYKDLTLFADSYLATEAEIEYALEEVRARYSTEEKYDTPITDRGGVKFEKVGIDYDWYVQGKLIKSEKDKFVVLSEASSMFPEGFATQLIGVKPGVTKNINVTFPDDKYIYGSYAGQDVTFVVTVKEIQGRYVLPELTDAFVQEASGGNYKTVDEYKAFFKDYIEKQGKQTIDEENSDAMWDAIIKLATVEDYPDEYVNRYFEESVEEYKSMASQSGTSYEELLAYMGLTEEAIMKEAKKRVKKELVYHAILEAEQLSLSDDDYSKAIKKYMDYYEFTEEELLEHYTEAEIRESALWDKTMEYLLKAQNFVVVENGVEYEKVDLSTVDFSKHITLGKYKGLTVDSRAEEYTDEELQASLKSYLELKAKYTKFGEMITDPETLTVRGDVLNIDFVGYVLGKEFEGGSAKNKEIKLMTNSGYIDGFADGLYGKKVGETVSVDVVFPEDYHAVELRGVNATFEIKINGIVGHYDIKELTDEYAKELSGDKFSTVDEYLADFRETRANAKKNAVKAERVDAILAAIKNDTTVIAHLEEQVMHYYAASLRQYQMMAEMYKVDVDEILSANKTSRASLYSQAQSSALGDLVERNIIAIEKIALEEGDFESALAELSASTGMSGDDIIAGNGREFVENFAIRQKLIDFLFENTTFNIK